MTPIMRLLGAAATILCSAQFWGSAPAWAEGRDVDLRIDRNVPFISNVTFPSLAPTPLQIAGQLRVPATGLDKYPAVVIVHGSAGLDSRERLYSDRLNRAGIATLAIDMWAARGWLGGVTGRPRGVPETLPDAYGGAEVPCRPAAHRCGAHRHHGVLLGVAW